MSLAELRKLARELGHDLSKGDLEAVVREMDVTGSGSIELSDFLAWWDRVKETKSGMCCLCIIALVAMHDSIECMGRAIWFH